MLYNSILKPVFLRSYPDIRGAADILRHLKRACIEHVTNTSDQEHLLHVALPEILASATYNGHVIDDHDWAVVKSMTMSLCSGEMIKVKMGGNLTKTSLTSSRKNHAMSQTPCVSLPLHSNLPYAIVKIKIDNRMHASCFSNSKKAYRPFMCDVYRNEKRLTGQMGPGQFYKIFLTSSA